jgi:ParB-like chromosome segregation protein Spo0J
MEYIEIKQLKPHPDNPRKISHKEMEKLCESLKNNKEYFEARPIICDKNYIVWAGNSRYKAALKLDFKKVPVHIIDLPEAKMREIVVRDNVNNGSWDTALLIDWDLDTLADFGLDFSKSFDENNLTDESQEPKGKKIKQKKVVTCPHCNKDFEL